MLSRYRPNFNNGDSTTCEMVASTAAIVLGQQEPTWVRLGKLSVSSVVFDESRREFVDDTFLSDLKSQSESQF